MSIALFVFPVLGLLAGVWLAMMYNTLIRKKNMMDEGWSGIDVQLKRRHNLIPNLVETVKGYAEHEQETLRAVTEMRSKSMGAKTAAQRGAAEGLLGGALGKLLAVAEDYPELRADENFRQLQDELSATEDNIQLARRYYNGCVRELNNAVQTFPSNLVANWFKFTTGEFFELDDDTPRQTPEVKF